MNHVGTVTLSSQDPPVKVKALLGEEFPTVTGGYGGWTLVERAREVSLTRWAGIEPLRMSVSLLLDDWDGSTAVLDDAIRSLEIMASPTRATAHGNRPPFVLLTGPVPHTTVVWVIEDLAWGDTVGDEYGIIRRQAVTVSLLQFVDVDVATGRSKGPKAGSTISAQGPWTYSGQPTKTATVHAGEDLRKVAARTLGKASRWGEIARLNGNIRDPRSVKAGQTVILPPR